MAIQLEAFKPFLYKPILIGGDAMKHYEMRDSTHDHDFIIHREDAIRLKDHSSARIKHFDGKAWDNDGFSTDMDSTITIDNYDFAVTMFQYRYDFFLPRAKNIGKDYFVISKEDLLLLKVLAATNRGGWESSLAENIRKQRRDVDLIIKSIVEEKYEKGEWDNAVSFNETFEREVNNLRF